MLKILLDPEHLDPTIEKNEIYVRGNALQIVSELGYVIADIYNGMKNSDPGMAEAFRHLVSVAYLPASPVWRTNTMTPGSECIFMKDLR